MNGDAREILAIKARLLLSTAAALSLCACVSVPVVEPYADSAVDPNSPAAAAIQAQAAETGVYPTFADIPQTPADIRSNEGWRLAVAGTEGERDELLRAVAPSTFTLGDSEGFAADVRAMIADAPAAPTAADAAETEAWAARMRERATPPPRPR